MTMKSAWLGVYGAAVVASALGCMLPSGGYGGEQRGFVQEQPGVDFCPQRLPAAQERIEDLYDRAQGTSRRDEMRAEVRDPMGNVISVSMSFGDDGAVLLDSVETGLSDIVLDCGDALSDKECFVEVFVDGESLLELGPTTSGRVPMRCLPSGDRLIRIDSVATTLFEGVVRLESDHEYLVTIAPEYEGGEPTLLINTVNRMIDRVPPVPTYENTAAVGGGASAGITIREGRHTTEATVSVGGGVAEVEHREAHAEDRFDAHEAVMSSSSFARLLRQVDDEMGSDAELRVVRAAAAHNLFTSAQVAALVEVATMRGTRVEVAVMLYPVVVDPEYFHEVLDALTFDASKREVVDRLGL